LNLSGLQKSLKFRILLNFLNQMPSYLNKQLSKEKVFGMNRMKGITEGFRFNETTPMSWWWPD